MRSIPKLGPPEAYSELTSFEIRGHISMTLLMIVLKGPQNVVESELGSKPSQIGVRFTTWLTSLNALSASVGRSISNRNRNVDTVRPCSAESIPFSLSTRFGVLA
jgi:hypothetical protein